MVVSLLLLVCCLVDPFVREGVIDCLVVELLLLGWCCVALCCVVLLSCLLVGGGLVVVREGEE